MADDMFTAQLLFPLYNHKIVLLADTPESGVRLGELLSAGRTGALLVSRNSTAGRVVAAASYAAVGRARKDGAAAVEPLSVAATRA